MAQQPAAYAYPFILMNLTVSSPAAPYRTARRRP
jgi:hypothetical protein